MRDAYYRTTRLHIWKYLLQCKESLRGVSLFMKFYVGWWSDSGVTERKRGRTKTKREKNKRETRETKRRKKTRVRVRALGDRKTADEERKEKEAKRTKKNARSATRCRRLSASYTKNSCLGTTYRNYRRVSSRGFNRTDFHLHPTVTLDCRIVGYWVQLRN